MADELLAWADVQNEAAKVKTFFERLPEDMRSSAAEMLVFEIVNCGSYNHFEALGILAEAMMDYRETSLKVMAEEEETTDG